MAIYKYRGEQKYISTAGELKGHLMPLIAGEIEAPSDQIKLLLEWKGKLTTHYLAEFWTMTPEMISEGIKKLGDSVVVVDNDFSYPS